MATRAKVANATMYLKQSNSAVCGWNRWIECRWYSQLRWLALLYSPAYGRARHSGHEPPHVLLLTPGRTCRCYMRYKTQPISPGVALGESETIELLPRAGDGRVTVNGWNWRPLEVRGDPA
jgi:hypothetical protein